jgi:hypothetical protein
MPLYEAAKEGIYKRPDGIVMIDPVKQNRKNVLTPALRIQLE